MMIHYSIIFALLTALSSSQNTLFNPHAQAPLKFTPKTPQDFQKSEAPTLIIDLDLPPKQRWKVLTAQHCKILKDNKESYISTIFKNNFKGNTPLFNEFVKESLDYLYNRADPEFRDEVIGLSEHCGLPVDYMLLYNYVYEFQILGCTSILYRDINTGSVTLGSNLDYNYFDIYIHLTVQGQFVKKGESTIEASLILGFLGYSRASKGELGFALNARNPRDRTSEENAVDRLRRHFKNGKGMSTVHSIRKIMEMSNNFNQLEQYTRNQELLSPAYFIISGRNQGVVITRDEKSVFNSVKLGDDGLSYVVQTNRDRDRSKWDVRRKAAQLKMSKFIKMKGYATSGDILSILSSSPNFMLEYLGDDLELRTISSSILSPSKNGSSFIVYLWKDVEKRDILRKGVEQ